MTTDNTLEKCKNHYFDRSESWWWCSLVVAILTPIGAIIIELSNKSPILTFISFVIILSPALITWSREIANSYYDKGSLCRRVILYNKGLGEPISVADKCEILEFSKNLKIPEYEKPYYVTEKNISPAKLVDMISESSFFTKYNAGVASDYLNKIFVFYLCVTLFIAYLCIEGTISKEATQVIAKSAFFVVALFIVNDFLLLKRKFDKLSADSNIIFRDSENLAKQSKISEYEALNLAERYNLILSISPPIPFFVYKKSRDELNKKYREAHNIGGKQHG